jgi:uncharacterized protein (TIGR03083 family)
MSDGAPLDLTPMLRPERAAFLGLLGGLDASDWSRPTECPAWDVRGVALHVLGDDLSLLSRQRESGTQGLVLYAEDHPGASFRELLDGFNEQWVTAAGFLGIELTLELLRLVGEWSADFYETVGLTTIAREPVGFFAATEPSPYWQLIAREYVERIVHHGQIRRAVGAPELDGRLVTEAARVVVHSLAVWLRDLDAPVGATLVVEFAGLGDWALRRGPDRWTVVDDAAAPDARVTIANASAVVSRGVRADEIPALITVEGDRALADGALAIAAGFVAPPA